MSWMAAASAGGAIVSGVSGSIGSSKASKAASQAFNEMRKMRKAQEKTIGDFSGLADKFAGLGQDQYDKYQDMFGGMEEKLSDYYMGLNPDELASQGNQTAQQQYQQTMNQFNDQMAAQGMIGSGQQAQVGLEGSIGMAQNKAQNIMNAPHQVAEMQQGWMNYGAGRQDNAWNQMSQGVGMQQDVVNMYGNARQNSSVQMQQMGNMYSQQAQQAQQQGTQGMFDGLSSAMYFGNQKPSGGGQSPFDRIGSWFSGGNSGGAGNVSFAGAGGLFQ